VKKKVSAEVRETVERTGDLDETPHLIMVQTRGWRGRVGHPRDCRSLGTIPTLRGPKGELGKEGEAADTPVESEDSVVGGEDRTA
jgi:hypothetical protein